MEQEKRKRTVPKTKEDLGEEAVREDDVVPMNPTTQAQGAGSSAAVQEHPGTPPDPITISRQQQQQQYDHAEMQAHPSTAQAPETVATGPTGEQTSSSQQKRPFAQYSGRPQFPASRTNGATDLLPTQVGQEVPRSPITINISPARVPNLSRLKRPTPLPAKLPLSRLTSSTPAVPHTSDNNASSPSASVVAASAAAAGRYE